MDSKIPTYNDIQETHERIIPFIHNTPVLTSESINSILKVELFFKCENFQKTGVFKYRGATNAVQKLDSKKMKYGVATHSSGNHAAALSLAAKRRNIPAYIVMPKNASKIKINAVRNYGGNITFCKSTLDAREKVLKKLESDTGAYFIHPYNNFDVICGQGTAAIEFLEKVPDLDYIIAPVGGGGLISGIAIAAKAINPKVKVYAAEPENADDAYRSFKQGVFIPVQRPKTIADGLLTSLSPLTFRIIRSNVDDILTVKEQTIIDAMRMIWERMKIIVEPSSAVALASVIDNKYLFRSKKIGIILSGGNVDLKKLPF
ncbi:MAG: pyridoxal-phosphate dependent enzyme [Bacteroidales bacterium]|jgi:threonine dehydratase|nr:pyridoxal-phosphate dependent enzyme [Bacteroidales bacterium]